MATESAKNYQTMLSISSFFLDSVCSETAFSSQHRSYCFLVQS